MLSGLVRNLLAPLALVAVSASAAPPKHARFFPNPLTRNAKPAAPGDPAIVNAASFLPGISPGGLASIFSHDLLSIDGTFSASSSPLPRDMANISVLVNGIAAPLLTVSSINGDDQINLQVPVETDTGPGAATIEIIDNGDTVTTFETDSYTEDPGIFVYRGYGLAIRNSNGQIVGIDNPVAPGDVIILYTTGLGPVTVDVIDGDPAPSDPLAYTQDPFDALVNGERCDVLFSGLAPGFTGLYQLNLRLPDDLPPGDLDLQISTPYANSGTVKIPVQ
jgi:uncharacterized protein (TIGR03437 family)